jgi:peptidoglycan hydrolase CwlO-like protein
MSYAIGSKEHFQNIFSRIEIDQNENPDLKIEQLLNEIDQLKRKIEDRDKMIASLSSHINWLDSKMEILND